MRKTRQSTRHPVGFGLRKNRAPAEEKRLVREAEPYKGVVRRTGTGRTTSWLPPRGKLAPVRTLVTDEGPYFFFRRCGNSRFTPTLIRRLRAAPSPEGEGKGSLRRTRGG